MIYNRCNIHPKATPREEQGRPKPLHYIFMDLEKAYNRVPRDELLYCMRVKEVPEKYVGVKKDMYQGGNTIVRCAPWDSHPFEVKVELHQGSALSPLLFAIIIDCLTGGVRKKA